MMTRGLRRLKEQIVRANLLAQEAAFFAEELNKKTEYLVTLQIPAANLNANRKVGGSTNLSGHWTFTWILCAMKSSRVGRRAGFKSRLEH